MPVVHLAVVFAKGHNGRLAVFVGIPLVEYVSNRGFQRLKCFSPIELVSCVDSDSEGRVRLADVGDVNDVSMAVSAAKSSPGPCMVILPLPAGSYHHAHRHVDLLEVLVKSISEKARCSNHSEPWCRPSQRQVGPIIIWAGWNRPAGAGLNPLRSPASDCSDRRADRP